MQKYNPKDLIGQTYQRLTVKDSTLIDKQTYLICECICGNQIKIFPYQFVAHSYSSCGCLKIENAKKLSQYRVGLKPPNYIDGRGKHYLHGTWVQMIARCENPKNPNYHLYGGRGIKVCDEWHDFNEFITWADSIGGRKKGYTLDRIDVNGNYEPSNCRFASNFTQQRNKNTNIFLTYNGVTRTLTDWAFYLGINKRTINNRYNRGDSIEKILDPTIHTRFPYNKKICCYDKNGKLLNTYYSFSELPPDINKKSLSNSVHRRNGHYKNMIWRFEDV